MTEKLTRRGVRVRSHYEPDVFHTTTVGAVMRPRPGDEGSSAPAAPAVRTDRPARRRARPPGADGELHDVPVVDDEGKLVGVCTRHDLLRGRLALLDHERPEPGWLATRAPGAGRPASRTRPRSLAGERRRRRRRLLGRPGVPGVRLLDERSGAARRPLPALRATARAGAGSGSPPPTDDRRASSELTDADYQRLLDLRDGLRRFLHWSEQQARPAGITPAQHQLLLAVRGHRGGPPTLGDVSAHLLLRHHSAVGLVDRAEAAGLVPAAATPTTTGWCGSRLTDRGAPTVLAALTAEHKEELERIGLDYRDLGFEPPPDLTPPGSDAVGWRRIAGSRARPRPPGRVSRSRGAGWGTARRRGSTACR